MQKLSVFVKNNYFLLIFLILPFIVFWRNFAPISDKVYFGNDSLISFYTLRSIMNQFVEGHLPLWDPHTFYGIPLLTRPDSLVFYPPLGFLVIFSIIFKFGMERFFVLMEAITVFHMSFAGICTYFFLRRLGLSKFSSFIGGIIYMFNGNIIAFTNTTGLLISMTWLPLIFLTYDSLVRKPSLNKALIFGLVFAVPITTFAWQNAITYHIYFLIFYTLFLIRYKEIDIEKSFLYIVFSFSIAVIIAGVVVLPGLEVPKVSDRAALDYGLSAYGGDVKFRELPDLIMPYMSAHSYAEGGVLELYSGTTPVIYVGILTLLLIVPAFFRKNKLVVFFFFISILFLLFSLGGETPIFDIFYIVLFPLMKPFRNINKIAYISFFCLSIVAAFGLENITTYYDEVKLQLVKYNKILLQLFVLMTSGLFLLVILGDQILWKFIPGSQSVHIFSFLNVVILFYILFSLSILCIGIIKPENQNYLKVLIFVVIFSDLFMFAKNYPINNYGKNPDKLFANSDVIKFITAGKNFTDRSDVRQIPNNYASALNNINHIDGYLVYRSSVLNKMLALMPLEPRNNLVDTVSNVKYIVSGSETVGEDYKLAFTETVTSQNRSKYYLSAPVPSGLDEAPEGVKIKVFENKNLIPYIHFVKKVAVKTDEAAAQILSNQKMDPLNEALISPDSAKSATDLGTGTVSFSFLQPYELQIKVHATKPSFIATSQPYYAEWKATLNGNPYVVTRTNISFMGFFVPQGDSTIIVKYYPKTFYTGLMITIVSLLGVIFLFILSIKFPGFEKRFFQRSR
ncbi:MAG TPA: YfhO family protein [Candidatus Saccharimonadales bacterium]|nr:YfhO family protein [Candidatus Saccharimonadales bacterium]